MIPALATNYPAGMGIADTVATAKLDVRPTLAGKVAHLAHVFCCNLCHVVKFAGLAGVSRSTPLSPHIMYVIRRRSHEQMCRITTRSIVTLVANKHAIRDRAIRKFIGHYMNAVSLVVLTSRNAIAGIANIRTPLPAIIGATAIHSLPELIGRLLKRLMMPQAKPCVLARNAIEGVICTLRDWRSLATSAKALTARIGNYRAIGFNRIGGIIGHADISFVDIGHVPGRSNVAGTLSYPHYCNTIEHTCNTEVAYGL